VSFVRELVDSHPSERDSFTALECEVGDEEADVEWAFDGEPITGNQGIVALSTALHVKNFGFWCQANQKFYLSEKYSVQAEGTKRKLFIKNLSSSDQGLYTCKVKAGHAVTQTRLSIKKGDLKILKKAPDVVAREGEKVTIDMEVSDEKVS